MGSYSDLTIDDRFKVALMTERCDIVNSMLANGYIPDRSSILNPCIYGNIDMMTRLLSCGADMDIQGGFLAAVMYGNVYLLDNLFLAGADVNYGHPVRNDAPLLGIFSGTGLGSRPIGTTYTPLHIVTDSYTCQWLLDMGAVQRPNELGETPLLIACICGNTGVAELLLQHGAQQTPDEYGNTPLSVCMKHNDTQMITLLSS